VDWHLMGLANLSALVGLPGLWAWTRDGVEPTPETHVRSAGDQSVDVRLIEIAYEVLASERQCAPCGAPLGRRLLVLPSAAEHSPWAVSVVTSCRGWQRHVHVAVAEEVSNGLMLGPFRAI
jgi:hypothetical protein